MIRAPYAQPLFQIGARMNADVFATFPDYPRQRGQPTAYPTFTFAYPTGKLRRRQEVIEANASRYHWRLWRRSIRLVGREHKDLRERNAAHETHEMTRPSGRVGMVTLALVGRGKLMFIHIHSVTWMPSRPASGEVGGSEVGHSLMRSHHRCSQA